MAVSLSVQSLKTRSTSYGVKKVYEVYKTVKANVPTKFVKVTFGTNNFDVPQIAIALLIVGVIIGLSGLILSIFATATAGAIANPSPGTLAYNLTHPLVNGMTSFYSFYPTLYILLGVTGIVLIAAGIIGIIMEKFKTS